MYRKRVNASGAVTRSKASGRENASVPAAKAPALGAMARRLDRLRPAAVRPWYQNRSGANRIHLQVSKIVMPSGNQARLVARLTFPANDRSCLVNNAGHRAAYFPFQGAAAIAAAAHPPVAMISIGARNAREGVLVFQTEPWPFDRVGAAGAASAAIVDAQGRRGRDLAQRRLAFRAA